MNYLKDFVLVPLVRIVGAFFAARLVEQGIEPGQAETLILWFMLAVLFSVDYIHWLVNRELTKRKREKEEKNVNLGRDFRRLAGKPGHKVPKRREHRKHKAYKRSKRKGKPAKPPVRKLAGKVVRKAKRSRY